MSLHFMRTGLKIITLSFKMFKMIKIIVSLRKKIFFLKGDTFCNENWYLKISHFIAKISFLRLFSNSLFILMLKFAILL